MKKLFLFYILWLLTGFAANGQSTEYFNKILSSVPGTSTISTVVKADSGYLLVVDNILPGQTTGHNQFLMINNNGVIIDSISFPDNKYRYTNAFPGNTALRTKSGKYLVATSRIDTSNAGYCVLICLDNNLDTLWTRTFPHPDTFAAAQPGAYVYNVHTSIRQTWDGGFIITGNYSKDCDPNQMRSYLLKTDSMGVMEWIKKYNDVQRIFAIKIAPDSGYFFPTAYNGHLCVIKTDTVGNIQWNVKVNSNTNPSFPMDLAILDDSNLVVVSSFWYDLNLYLSAVTVTKVNFISLVKVWEKNYYLFRNFKCHSLHQTVTIHALPDASIVLASTSTVYEFIAPAEYKGVMMKLTPNGDSLWARYYGYGPFNHACQFDYMIPTADGGFLAVGFYYPNGPSRPWLVKTDSMGCATPGCHSIGIEERVLSKEGLEVFPNPFSDAMHVVLPEGFLGGKLVMFDIQGRRTIESSVPESYEQQNFTVQTGHLKPGMYLLDVEGKDGRVWRRKVVKGK